jgi:hypothetical protein
MSLNNNNPVNNEGQGSSTAIGPAIRAKIRDLVFSGPATSIAIR